MISNGGRLEVDIHPLAGGGLGVGPEIRALEVRVETGGGIIATNRGFRPRLGPGTAGTNTSIGATHGGMGSGNTNAVYGSVLAPRSGGSGSYWWAGGGAILLLVTNTLRVDGVITADGGSYAGYSGSAGGSISLRAGTFTGTGTICANGGTGPASGHRGGGGGRIAVRSRTNSFAGTVSAYGGQGQSGRTNDGAAGTVYWETETSRVLWVHNPTNRWTRDCFTELPSAGVTDPDALETVTLVVTNRGAVRAASDFAIGDLYLRTGSFTSLYLQGRTLSVNSFYHEDWGSTSQVHYAGGRIVWRQPSRGTLLLLW